MLDLWDRYVEMFEKLPFIDNEWKGRNGHGKRNLTLSHKASSTFVQDVREVSSFHFHALLALEGLAIHLSFNKDSPNKRLVSIFERLAFATERISDLLIQKVFKYCFEKETADRLKHLVRCGNKCFMMISRQMK